MNTLIELYDERAIENILAPDMFRPQRIVYLCPGEIVRDRTRQEKLTAFFSGGVGIRNWSFWNQACSKRTAFCASSSPSAKNIRTAPST